MKKKQTPAALWKCWTNKINRHLCAGTKDKSPLPPNIRQREPMFFVFFCFHKYQTHTAQGEFKIKLKCTFIVQTTTSLYGVWIPKWKHTPGSPSPGFLLRERAAWRANASLLLQPSRLGRRGNYIIWRWNESTLQAKVSEMLYCMRNCQLKSNTWNAEAQLKQPFLPWQTWNQSVPCSAEAPRECFSFHVFPPFTLSLFVKSCRQCTFTLAYIAHKSPKPDVRINKAHFLGRAYGTATM